MIASFEIPVLFIIFNRPDTTQVVFEQIKRVRPKYLFIAADGPRNNEPKDKNKCNEARSIAKQVDWDCDLKLFFRDENVGCGRGPSEAITWFFEHVEMGIILEDDCVPSIPFFQYTEYLLKKYKHDTRVWIVSGRSHYHRTSSFKNQDYLFSNYVVTWGWGTWKRCWNKFDLNIRTYWPEFHKIGGFKNVFFTKIEGIFRNLYYKRLLTDKELESHVWDYQFMLNMHQNRGLGIVPSKNLVENIGYEGTHFVGTTKIQKFKAENDFQIAKEPKNILLDRKYETAYFYNEFKLRFLAFLVNRYLRIKNYFFKNTH